MYGFGEIQLEFVIEAATHVTGSLGDLGTSLLTFGLRTM